MRRSEGHYGNVACVKRDREARARHQTRARERRAPRAAGSRARSILAQGRSWMCWSPGGSLTDIRKVRENWFMSGVEGG